MFMMFGDKPASNWAMRLSGFMADVTAAIANASNPVSPRVQESFDRLMAAWEEDPSLPHPRLLHSFVSCFIDDFSM
jgi:hypothetical protein